MEETVENLLNFLKDKDAATDTLEIARILCIDHQRVVGAVKSLQSLGNIIEAIPNSSKRLELTSEGQEVVSLGSHEARLFRAVPDGGIPQKELMASIPNAKVGFSKAMSCGWIMIEKNSPGGPLVFHKVANITDDVQECLKKLKDSETIDLAENLKQDLKKRKLLQEIVIKSYLVAKGSNFSTTISKPETDLTPEMISSGSWKEKSFKSYNFAAMGVPTEGGHLHPLLKVRAEFRKIFIEMGFSEMPTNRYIESSFWNFDALFQPQQHPARDVQDTFFVSDPAMAKYFPEDYLEKVKRVHSIGGYGSQGYKCEWKREEASKNVLRTHTTAISARMLYALSQNGFKPAKYFSIDRVFRNESLDATHLAEFHQIEGVVIDKGLSLGNLMGILQEFFRKLGIDKLRFKAAYNPYTEPSMEIFSYHEGLGKWVEVGNSGVFRPELLLPMGLPEDVTCLGFGLSLERPTMIKYKIDNIRDLVGPKVNLQMVYENPICRLDC